MDLTRGVRKWAVLILAAAVLSSAGCYVEQRADGKWWACDTVQTAMGPVTACQPLDLAVLR